MLIYISGIDGCGKTTQAQLLVKKLQEEGLNAEYIWLRWEPMLRKIIAVFQRIKQGKLPGEKASRKEKEDHAEGIWQARKQKILANGIANKVWMLYACADYYWQYLRQRKLFNADIIVLDRYLDDFIIDQSVNFGIQPADSGRLLDNFLLKRFPKPDLRIIISLPPEEGYRRKMDGTSMQYLRQRATYYQKISTWNDAVAIDGCKDIETLHAEIVAIVSSRVDKEVE